LRVDLTTEQSLLNNLLDSHAALGKGICCSEQKRTSTTCRVTDLLWYVTERRYCLLNQKSCERSRRVVHPVGLALLGGYGTLVGVNARLHSSCRTGSTHPPSLSARGDLVSDALAGLGCRLQ
jgi:hypothetical protein